MTAIQRRSMAKRHAFLGTLVMGMVFVLSGCDTTSAFLSADAPPCAEPPCRIKSWWMPNMMSAADSLHNGAPLQGLAGRVYLFGVNDMPVVGEGSLVVGLFDATPRPDGTGPVPVHEWTIDPETLQRLLKKDVIGWGYTLFLPWPEDKAPFNHVELRVRFNQANRAPLFSDTSSFVLDGPGTPTTQITHSMKPLGQK